MAKENYVGAAATKSPVPWHDTFRSWVCDQKVGVREILHAAEILGDEMRKGNRFLAVRYLPEHNLLQVLLEGPDGEGITHESDVPPIEDDYADRDYGLTVERERRDGA